MSLLDWFTARRKFTIAVIIILIIAAIAISSTRSNCASKAILTFFDEWSVPLSAGAALCLLYIAYMEILKAETARREDRELDFKRRQLDGILDWAQEVKKELLMPRSSELADFELKNGLANCSIRNEWVIMTAQIFGQEFQGKVDQAARDIYAFLQARKEDMVNYDKALRSSVNGVLEAAFKLKIDRKL